MPDYHHTVTEKATLFGECTKRCRVPETSDMDRARVRRVNLRRFIATHLDGNQSSAARLYGSKPSYINDLLRTDTKRPKSFGEKVARGIEEALGLVDGQLDVPDSPLLIDERRRSRIRERLQAKIDEMDDAQLRELHDAATKIRVTR